MYIGRQTVPGLAAGMLQKLQLAKDIEDFLFLPGKSEDIYIQAVTNILQVSIL